MSLHLPAVPWPLSGSATHAHAIRLKSADSDSGSGQGSKVGKGKEAVRPLCVDCGGCLTRLVPLSGAERLQRNLHTQLIGRERDIPELFERGHTG